MKKLIFCALLLFHFTFSNAQSFNRSLDVIPVIQKIDQLRTAEEFEKAIPVLDAAGNRKNYVHYTFIADTLTQKLVKVNVDDRFSKISRSYYFHNECLLVYKEHNENINTDECLTFLNVNYNVSPDYTNLQDPQTIKFQLKIAEGYKLLLYFKSGKFL